jgi:hypothetical protein
MEYRMIDNVTLSNFRRFMQSGVPLKEFGPQGAFDSKPSRRGRDEDDPSESRGDIARMMKTIARGMSPENWAKWREELLEDGAEDGEYTTPEDRLEAEAYPGGKRATDEPAPFKGRPRPGGAMDGLAFDGPPRRKSSGEKSFAAMYGDAALSIKTNSDPYPIASRTRT